jgi:hypothetical protein
MCGSRHRAVRSRQWRARRRRRCRAAHEKPQRGRQPNGGRHHNDGARLSGPRPHWCVRSGYGSSSVRNGRPAIGRPLVTADHGGLRQAAVTTWFASGLNTATSARIESRAQAGRSPSKRSSNTTSSSDISIASAVRRSPRSVNSMMSPSSICPFDSVTSVPPRPLLRPSTERAIEPFPRTPLPVGDVGHAPLLVACPV